jgi:hypothetical protein
VDSRDKSKVAGVILGLARAAAPTLLSSEALVAWVAAEQALTALAELNRRELERAELGAFPDRK